MNFTPKTEKELSNLFPEATYDFEIVEARDTLSKNENDMIELKVVIYNGDKTIRIFDYLLEAIAYKLRHCADACGLLSQYETGTLKGEMFVGKTGKCKVVIKVDKDGKYPDKNEIKDYVKRDAAKAAPSAAKGQDGPPPPSDDDNPFA